MTALVLLESAAGRLGDDSFRLIAAARRLATEVHAAVIDRDDGIIASAAACIDGLGRLVLLPAADPDCAGFAATAMALAPLASDYAEIIAADSGRGRSVLPLLAANLQLAPLTSVAAIHADGRFERPIHAGSVIESMRFEAPLRLFTVRAAAFSPAGQVDTPCPIERLAPLGDDRVVIARPPQPASDAPHLETARLVLAGGRGLGSADAFRQLETVAARLGAAWGASRIAVDMGWAPHEAQIGQTGRRIAPSLYVAFGISGAAQHLAGTSEAACILAVNKDAEAPIFRHADLGLVADANEVLADLVARLAADRTG